MSERMTKTERRAAEACRYFERFGGGEFAVVWKKSALYGRCPSIAWRGEKAAYASGCGYDKLSAVLCEFLRTLVAEGALRGCSGAGLQTVQDRLAGAGWELTRTYDGTAEDGFQLRKA